ncbi:MAG: uroporphyrinogen-III C-methyltransferase [Anaerolineae bacterium]|nr:uroporphyrinogen-III C-methyltransferase [Anaerolineae bacterium]
MTKQGTLYLVGAGPGDTGLMTVKGMALLREADAIVADILGNAQLLQEANPTAERYDIGSRGRGNKQAQQDVTRLLLELAGQGKTVVRLWQGDPFVFGRATKEMAAAIKAGIRVELVPGVTSAIAALAYAGVPVTDWDYGADFAVVSGYVTGSAIQPNWEALAGIKTVVILMPFEKLTNITTRLQAAGRSPNTPALIVQNGTLPTQKQVVATLSTVADLIDPQEDTAPAIVVIGDTVALADKLHWFEPDRTPLLGKRVLVTRPTHQAADFMATLRRLGAEPISFPTIEIQPAEDTRQLDAAILRLAEYRAKLDLSKPHAQRPQPPYQWLVLTSANGVTAFWQRLAYLGLDARCLASVNIAAIGPATASVLLDYSIRADLIPEVYTAEGVLAAFDALGSVAGQRFLLARADIARKTLAEGLQQRGAWVDEFAAYRTVPVEGKHSPPPADIVTFTSSSTVQGYVNCLDGRNPAEALADSQVVCIGPITAATAEKLGVPVQAVAEEYTIEGIVEALKNHAGREA